MIAALEAVLDRLKRHELVVPFTGHDASSAFAQVDNAMPSSVSLLPAAASLALPLIAPGEYDKWFSEDRQARLQVLRAVVSAMRRGPVGTAGAHIASVGSDRVFDIPNAITDATAYAVVKERISQVPDAAQNINKWAAELGQNDNKIRELQAAVDTAIRESLPPRAVELGLDALVGETVRSFAGELAVVLSRGIREQLSARHVAELKTRAMKLAADTIRSANNYLGDAGRRIRAMLVRSDLTFDFTSEESYAVEHAYDGMPKPEQIEWLLAHVNDYGYFSHHWRFELTEAKKSILGREDAVEDFVVEELSSPGAATPMNGQIVARELRLRVYAALHSNSRTAAEFDAWREARQAELHKHLAGIEDIARVTREVNEEYLSQQRMRSFAEAARRAREYERDHPRVEHGL
jgi:hypothetical protein